MRDPNEKHEHGTEQYKLVTSLRITKEVWRASGPDGEGYWESPSYNEGLTINEETVLGSMDFLGVMQILGKLHETIRQIPKSD